MSWNISDRIIIALIIAALDLPDTSESLYTITILSFNTAAHILPVAHIANALELRLSCTNT